MTMWWIGAILGATPSAADEPAKDEANLDPRFRLTEEQARWVAALEANPNDETAQPVIDATLAANRACRENLDAAAWDRAIPTCWQTVRLFSLLWGAQHVDIIEPVNNLAWALESSGYYADAAPYYEHSISVATETLGQTHLTVASLWMNYGVLHTRMGDLTTAADAYTHADAIVEQHGEDATALQGTLRSNQSQLALDQGDLDRAVQTAREALAIAERIEAPARTLAIRLTNLGGALDAQGKYLEVVSLYRRSLALAESTYGPHHPTTSGMRANLALVLVEVGEAAQGVALLNQALADDTAALGPDHPAIADHLGNLAGVLRSEGRIGEAAPLAERALAITEARLGPDHPDVVLRLVTLARVRSAEGRLDEAEALAHRATEVARAADAPNKRIAAWRTLARVFDTLDRSTDARAQIDKALNLAREHFGADALMTAHLDAEIAEFDLALGRAGEADSRLRRAIAVVERALGPDHPDLATLLAQQASLMLSRGRFAEALATARRALTSLEAARGTSHPDVIGAVQTIGDVLLRKDDQVGAEPWLRRAVALWRASRAPGHPDISNAVNKLAMTLKQLGRFDEAEAQYRTEIDNLDAALGDGSLTSSIVLANLGNLVDERGDPAAGNALRVKAVEGIVARAGPEHPILAGLSMNLVGGRIREGQAEAAIAPLRDALRIEERVLLQSMIRGSPSQRQLDFAQLHGPTQWTLTAHLLHLRTHPEATALAFETVLRRKGRMTEVSRDTRGYLRERGDAQALGLLDDIQHRIAELGVLHAQLDADPSLRESLLPRTREAYAAVERLNQALAEHSDAFREASQPITVDRVAAALPEGTKLVEYVAFSPIDFVSRQWGAPRYGAYILDASGRISAIDLGPASVIDSAVLTLRQAIRTRQPLANLASRLRQLVIDPLGIDASRIVVAADGQLNLVPFQVLLSEDVRITYVSSGRELVRRPADAPSGRPLVVYDVDYGDALDGKWPALPATLQEGRDVRRRLRRPRTLTGTDATTTAVTQFDASPRVLHIATHGFFRPLAAAQAAIEGSGTRGLDVRAVQAVVEIEAPPSRFAVSSADTLFDSGLVFAGANLPVEGIDDGLLTAAELLSLDLHGTDLVVLSACETGLGEVVAGAGVAGIRQGLAIAGARTQVLSLWRVEDEATAALMAEFYRGLKRGHAVGDAFFEAQRAIRAQPKWSHPYFWAAFTVSGDPTVVVR